MAFLLAFPARAKLFNGEEFFLPNGMQVIVVPNHKAPIVKHMVWYKSGSVDEAPGKGGSAHLLEHLMFRGTAKVPGDGLNKILEQNGAESNAFTGPDMTAYHQLVDISRLELAMALEADRMQNLKLRDKDFALE
ncbi:M16 family metallopeptidase, partial [Candidatus Avelusimicrobium faecicola]|uniref:M16 family metallopeptidase n=1 Tax=Candidatus Avelusimicrobium faecicola TaxID=3416205 RepID=UPI003D0A2F0F